MKARGVYVEHDGLLQPAPAPRFSRTEATLTTGPSVPGGGHREAVLEAGASTGVDKLPRVRRRRPGLTPAGVPTQTPQCDGGHTIAHRPWSP